MLASCAGDPPKPAPTVTPEQVRTHADKAFEKLKQEEQSRSADPTVPRY
jgi:ABC-type transporter MlaC component